MLACLVRQVLYSPATIKGKRDPRSFSRPVAPREPLGQEKTWALVSLAGDEID